MLALALPTHCGRILHGWFWDALARWGVHHHRLVLRVRWGVSMAVWAHRVRVLVWVSRHGRGAGVDLLAMLWVLWVRPAVDRVRGIHKVGRVRVSLENGAAWGSVGRWGDNISFFRIMQPQKRIPIRCTGCWSFFWASARFLCRGFFACCWVGLGEWVVGVGGSGWGGTGGWEGGLGLVMFPPVLYHFFFLFSCLRLRCPADVTGSSSEP